MKMLYAPNWFPISFLSACALLSCTMLSSSGDIQNNAIQAEPMSFAESFSRLESHASRLDALTQLEKMEREILAQRTIDTPRLERINLLRKWQDALELGFILRNIYSRNIASEIFYAQTQNRLQDIETLSDQLMEIGNGDFTEELNSVLSLLPNSKARDNLQLALAKFSHGNAQSAKIFVEHLQNPSTASLEALVQSTLPAPWLLESYIQQSGHGEAELLKQYGVVSTHVTPVGDVKLKTNPQNLAHALEARQKSYAEMRDAIKKSLQKIPNIGQPLLSKIEPLINAPQAQHDSDGWQYTIHGVTLREGDVVAWRFYPAAYSWEAFSDSPGHYSHVGMVAFSEAGEPLVVDQDVSSINKMPFADALHRGSHISIFRDTTLNANQRANLNKVLNAYNTSEYKPFDFHFSLINKSRFYCSEHVLATREAAGLPEHIDFAHARSARVAQFFKDVGVTDANLMAPLAFLLDPKFTHVGTFYQDGAGDLVAASAMINAMLNAFEKASSVDFSKSQNVFQAAATMQFARLFNIGGMRDMNANFAKNFASMDTSVINGQKLVQEELAVKGYTLQQFSEYQNAANAIAQKIAAQIYQRAFGK